MDSVESMTGDAMAVLLARLHAEIAAMDAALTRLDREVAQISDRAWEAQGSGRPIPDDAGREDRLVLASCRLDSAMRRRKAVADALRSASAFAQRDDAAWAEVRDILDDQAAVAPALDERTLTDDQWDAVVGRRVLTDAAEAIDAALTAGVAR